MLFYAFTMAGIEWYSNTKKCVGKRVPLCNLANVQLRFLCPSDINEVKALCQNWFPIDYPAYWYEDITSNPRIYSLAAMYDGIIIGLIVAEIQDADLLDDKILAQTSGEETTIGYILSLGVSEKHRRNGIASLLLDNLISHLTTAENSHCKALFLHVLTTNRAAIHFYQYHHFRCQEFLPYYYYIDGNCKDGFMYVLYINGGHPPWGLQYKESMLPFRQDGCLLSDGLGLAEIPTSSYMGMDRRPECHVCAFLLQLGLAAYPAGTIAGCADYEAIKKRPRFKLDKSMF